MSSNLNNTQVLAVCPIEIAIIVDESGSISASEAVQIRDGLLAFVNGPMVSNMTLSLIGISASDIDNRTDHLLRKKVSDSLPLIVNWIDNIRKRPGGDNWNSGLSVADTKLLTVPDIIVVITDGAHCSDYSRLANTIAKLNAKSHIVFYAISSGIYNILNTEYFFISNYLTLLLGRTPVLKTNSNSILESDYISIADFRALNTALNNLSAELQSSSVGCIPNVEITESNLSVPIDLYQNSLVNTPAGTLKLKNKSRLPFKLYNNILIHADNTINGLTFNIDLGANASIDINPNTEVPVNIRVKGTPIQAGSFGPKSIAISGIYNIKDFKISFSVLPPPNPVIEIRSDVVLSLIAGNNYNHQEVGVVYLKNTSGKDCTLSNVRIHSSSSIGGGLVFSATGTIPAYSEKPIPVYADHSANQLLSNYEELLLMSAPNVTFVPNTQFKLRLNVTTTPKAKIDRVDLKNEIYTKDWPLSSPSLPYGTIRILNENPYSPFIIPAGPKDIWYEPSNKFRFITSNTESISIPAGGGWYDIPVNITIEAPDLKPVVVGDFGESLNIENSLGVNNPQQHGIEVHVKLEDYKASIVGSNLPLLNFYSGKHYVFNNYSYGSFTIQNDTKTRSIEIEEGDTLFSAAGFTFSVFNNGLGKIVIGPEQSRTINIVLNADITPTLLQSYSRLIDINNVSNLGHVISLNVIEEPLDVRITRVELYSNALTFTQGEVIFPETASTVGVIYVRNYTETRGTVIQDGMSLIPDNPGDPYNGVSFSTRGRVPIDPSPAGSAVKEYAVYIKGYSIGGALNIGNGFNFEIDMLPVASNPNHYSVSFNVAADILELEVVGAEFSFPKLIKGVSVSQQTKLGRIWIENKSRATPTSIGSNTKIHFADNILGLRLATNTVTPIAPQEVKEIDIYLNPSLVTPTGFGRQEVPIWIEGVKNIYPYMIRFDVLNNGIPIDTDEGYSLQSPNFALQAVGSSGSDSPKSIQLRWLFSGDLGRLHIPKGDYFDENQIITDGYHYNKHQDYVKLYRVPYTSEVVSKCRLNLLETPFIADDDNQRWLYRISGSMSSDTGSSSKVEIDKRVIYVYFRNKIRYNEVRARFDPRTETQNFIDSYGENIIEIECKEELFFKVTPVVGSKQRGTLSLEVLSVEENKLVISKYLSFRRKMTQVELNSTNILSENGRSIRYKAVNFKVYSFDFEFYSDFIASASAWQAWEYYSDFALTTVTTDKYLDRMLDNIHGKWLRYNDGEYVNKLNYFDKWRKPSGDDNPFNVPIVSLVENYLRLSQDGINVRAEEYIDINFAVEETEDDDGGGGDEPGEEEGTLVSYLDLLNASSLDYHLARLLGLGAMDIDPTSGAEYIYLTEYRTFRDPNNVKEVKDCQLISMSLPTSTNTERLPLPIEIYELYKGVPRSQNEDIPVLYDEEGYSLDGKSRFVSIINKPVPSAEVNPSFFPNEVYWNASLYTLPVYAGLEHKIVARGGIIPRNWKRPELSHSDQYYNVNSRLEQGSLETAAIMLPENFGDPLYVHRHTESGTYIYSTYGINIFSRAASSQSSLSIVTDIKPSNNLLPPSDIKAWLIQPEEPLMFTSEFEQNTYKNISVKDKTLVRLNFGYDSKKDMVVHSIPFDAGVKDESYETDPTYFPDVYDVFASNIEVYFRKDTPRKITASLFNILPDYDRLCSVFQTRNYDFSNEDTGKSELPDGTGYEHFTGSVLVVNHKSYVIKSVRQGLGYTGLEFTVYKEEVSNTILSGGSISVQFNSLTPPETSGNDLFVVMENMQSVDVWGKATNPNSHRVPLIFPRIHREVITSVSEKGQEQRYLEKSRGYWDTANITQVWNGRVFEGVYRITFDNLKLEQRILGDATGFMDITNGMVRLFRTDSFTGEDERPKKTRDNFKVIKAENFGFLNRNPFTLYIYDELYASDGVFPVKDGGEIKVNYYPSYNLYLYSDASNDLVASSVLPTGDQHLKYSVFGLRTVASSPVPNSAPYRSKFSSPSLMLGQKIIIPGIPELPEGSLYATRPDFYGRSTYSFTTKFSQRPFGVQFCRADNNALLNALYQPDTLKEIYENLSVYGGNNEEYLTDRWKNFFDFEYYRIPNNPNDPLEDHEQYKEYPEVVRPGESRYRLPLPDKEEFFKGINTFIKDYIGNAGSEYLIDESDFGLVKLNHIVLPPIAGLNTETKYLIDFIQEVFDQVFVPLTEVPVLYQHIKRYHHKIAPYVQPLDKKQNIRDGSGYLLKAPSDPNLDQEFDMAPMMTILNESDNLVLFTDFTLNGTTDNVYFYASREVGSQMTVSDLSPVLGPVKLVGINAPEAPKILSGLPVLENRLLDITAKIQIDVHAYPSFAGIKRLNLYRSVSRLDAESVLSMTLVKQIDVSEFETTDGMVWTLYDELSDFEQIPYGDTLYYRVTADKQVEYAEYKNGENTVVIDYVSSQSSKLLALMLVETQNPASPILKGTGTRPDDDADFVNNVIFEWDVTCYRGIYHLYSMSGQGNWKEIARLVTNQTQDKVQLQVYNPEAEENLWENKSVLDIIDSTITLASDLLGANYTEYPLFDAANNRKYYHFKVLAENTSSMFSKEENILTMFTDDIWNTLTGISSDGYTNGMIIGKTFIIK